MSEEIQKTSQGTYARLYEVQEEMSRRSTNPRGRPHKKIQRKPTTVHLTSLEKRNLNELKLLVDEQFIINQSELIGLAIDTLNMLMQKKGKIVIQKGEVRDVDSFRRLLYEIIKS